MCSVNFQMLGGRTAAAAPARIDSTSGRFVCITVPAPIEIGAPIELRTSHSILLGEAIACQSAPGGCSVRLAIKHTIDDSAVPPYWPSPKAGNPEGMPEPFVAASAQPRIAERERWIQSMYGLPSVFGRLARLAARRDVASGDYSDGALIAILGAEAGDAFLRDLHYQVFCDWLSLSIEEKLIDVGQYLSDEPGHRRDVVQAWLKTSASSPIVPSAASAADRDLYFIELRVIAAIIAGEDALPAAEQAPSVELAHHPA